MILVNISTIAFYALRGVFATQFYYIASGDSFIKSWLDA